MIFYIIICLLLLNCMCYAKDNYSFERHLFPCHSTDYACFKRQYKALRDHVLLGQEELSINTYEPYTFLYGDTGTCVKISGLEHSELIGIRYDSTVKEMTLKLELPLKIEQIMKNDRCRIPKHNIGTVETFTGDLHKFSGKATIEVVYPYQLKKKKNNVYMNLLEESIDILLDIPELRGTDVLIVEDFLNSEWAFTIAEHFDAAEYIGLPYTDKYRIFTASVPLNKYLMLYPEEDYDDVQISYDDDTYRSIMCYKLF